MAANSCEDKRTEYTHRMDTIANSDISSQEGRFAFCRAPTPAISQDLSCANPVCNYFEPIATAGLSRIHCLLVNTKYKGAISSVNTSLVSRKRPSPVSPSANLISKCWTRRATTVRRERSASCLPTQEYVPMICENSALNKGGESWTRDIPVEKGINAVPFFRSPGDVVQRSGMNSFGFGNALSTV
jgi:hypothetical protein